MDQNTNSLQESCGLAFEAFKVFTVSEHSYRILGAHERAEKVHDLFHMFSHLR